VKGIQPPEWFPALRSWVNRQPRISLAAGALAVLLLCWALYVPPLLAIRQADAKWNQLRAEVEESRRLMDGVRAGEIRLLPAQQDLPQVLMVLQAQARDCRVNLLEISPGRADFTDPARPAFLPVEMRVEGEYQAIGEFLGKLREDPALGVVTVRSMRMGREERLLPRLRAQLSVEIALRQGGGAENGP